MAASTVTKPLNTEAIARTEKKMDMTLDDIIKMSKEPGPKIKNHRVPNKSQNFSNGGAVGGPRGNAMRGNSLNVRKFMDSRSSIRQGALAQRRSSFEGNHFPLATEVARKAMTAPVHNRPFNHNRNANWNKPRIGAPPIQKTAERNFRWKQQQQMQQPAKAMTPRQRPQTMDALFANMKEERMRMLQSQQNNNQHRTRVQAQQNYPRHGVVENGHHHPNHHQQQHQQQRGRGRDWFGN